MERRRGPWTFLFEPELGYLRYVSYQGTEVVRGIYAAVRDENWGTAGLSLRRSSVTDDVIEWEIDAADLVTWSGRIALHEDSIAYEVHGAVKRDFRTRRTGLCLLHPIAGFGGRPWEIEHVGGHVSAGAFPDLLDPFLPAKDIRAVTDLVTGVSVRLEGETFEMEDQRNYSDASYKTYCRPQEWPQPYTLLTGEIVSHRALISATGRTVEWQPLPPPVPSVGQLGLGTVVHAGSDIEPDQAAMLRSLDHIVVVIDPQSPAANAIGLRNADWIGAPLVVIAAAGAAPTDTAAAIAPRIPIEVRVCDLGADPAIWRAAFPGVPVMVQAFDNFVDLNRVRPPGWDGAAFALNPQVHAFDRLTIEESTECHPHMARTALATLSEHVSVGPVRFQNRGGTDDPRLAEIGPRFLNRSIERLRNAGVRRATYFESHGPRGVFVGDASLAGILVQANANSSVV